jgi:hypothetical protein
VGDDEPGLVEAAMVEINAAVRGGIITTEPVLFPDARASAIDKVTKRYAEPKKDHKRPPLAEILKVLRIKSPKDLVSFRRSRRIIAIPVDVEPHCLRASFSLVYPQAHKLWLYLIDPAGAAVDMTAPGVHHRISGAPHEFAVVERPKAGRWYMVAVRPLPGPGFRFRAVAGGENRNLQVFGTADTENAAGSPVRLRASARWLHELSNLKVDATIFTPGGGKVRLRMTDDASDQPSSGVYQTYFTPDRPGRHHAIIRVRGTGRAQIARPEHLIAHAQGSAISLKTEAPRFVRRIPVYFDSGDRPEIKDDERAKGLVDKYRTYRPRPSKLRSANKGRRGAQRSGR